MNKDKSVCKAINDLPSVESVSNSDKLKAYKKALEDIRAEIEEQVLESLSDGGDDWFTAEKVNECLEIIDTHNPDKVGK